MNTQKIQASKNVKGFTLVELIVVITILAILGTIAFLSLQGQSASARDSKRKTDLSSIMSKITITQAGGASLPSLVSSGAAQQVVSISIAGASPAAGAYTAGIPNFTALGVNSTAFADADGVNTYKMGVSTLDGGVVQLAAKLENDASGNPGANALILGTYNARGNTTSANQNSVFTNTGAVTGTTVTIGLADADVGKFKTSDTLAINGTCTTVSTITAVSSDLKTLSVNCAGTAAATTLAAAALKLNNPETAGLIASTVSTAVGDVVVSGSGRVLPY